MKHLQLIAALFLLASTCGFALDEYKEIPVTGDDLKNALNLKISKYQITFDSFGHATLEVKGGSGLKTLTMSSLAKTANLVIYIEKGTKSDGVKVSGMDTLHFWISSDDQTQYSYIAFEADKSKFTTTKFKDGVFSIVAKSSEKSDDNGYTVHVTNTK